ncbi:UDP-N-acetylmuramoyl-L-alanyl-D-glutamate--2,6-diaminopimelate ligase [Fumia xinanensis]|uniref:UDP-N-acetylmuramoyl-L-alanyl-D-glutamate--2,6-diaminopimelate ligase n=1 Tax=Fumia xinanensis TaxID=2763659 RepID=A0A926I7H1_9FIRM|nr:UDP-N-acetylmuramoyl-L-alanyl-D-glutamate--2,6-diaminopimelate ligase [Fumia xinanensis]MBC8559964.1 UDP-N-acetylmuramoyl-L-alanyl-D-glutamate--2,6-diaminopimelate ligase [Fumia xinanensis]
MLLSALLDEVQVLSDYEDRDVGTVVNDSRNIKPGDVFVCINGAAADGHTFADAALQKGASAIVCERDLGLKEQILVPDTHLAYSKMAANYYGNPSKKLRLIGVTGTNGKTTTTKLIKSVLTGIGKKVGLIGSIQNEIGDEVVHAEQTTPDAMELEGLYARMADAGCEFCVMEVSSHALDQRRIGDSHYEVAVFTNLTQDHLDYHKTMENYFEAKAKLFDICDSAVINYDDPYGQRLLKTVSCPMSTVSMESQDADLHASDVVYHPDGVEYRFDYQGVVSKVSFGMPGIFSVKNSLTAIAVCLRLGICIEKAVDGINMAQGVRGRSEIVPTGRDFTVICDHAHTPDGLENILSALKQTTRGRLIALFGCGGDRDRLKRPLMAKSSAKFADMLIVTSDNPRTEDPKAIIDDILPGLDGLDIPYEVIVNRKEAIFYAVQNARPCDTIVLAGKGHEDYQIIGHEKHHFDEREIVAEALKTLS